MDLTELKEYPHKIIKINVDNKNDLATSMSDTALLKVTLSKEDNEIIIFSYDKDLNKAINRTKTGNDYFLTIPNIEGVTTIYAHFLMADLYNDVESSENSDYLVQYDLSQLKNVKDTNNYGYYISDDAKPQISSKLEKSIHKNTQEKNPNYKQYNTDVSTDGYPIKDKFPISSRYATSELQRKELIAPDIQQTPLAKFKKGENNTTSQWEAHIPRTDIGDIIPKDTGKQQYPINVFLNYEYLPTSTEYHQHFYGFESHKNTENRDINIFEGDNLETVNGAFFDNDDKKYTYRLINWGDKTDHSNAFFINRDALIIQPTETSESYIINNSCDWIKNNCEDFYIYTALTDNADRGLYYPVTLKENTSYILKYYMFIPNDINTTNLTSYIEVQSIGSDGNIIDSWSIDDVFKKQDEFLTNQWVYHEVPFKTTVKSHHIHIQGHRDINKNIYFANIYIQENPQYSPTIKYTNYGVFVVEGDKSTIKPNTDYERTNYPEMQYTPPKIATLTEPNIPYNDIYVSFDEDFSISYNKSTKKLSYYPNKGYKISYSQTGNINEDNEEEEPWGLYINNNYNINDDDSNVEFDHNTPILELDENKNLLFRYNAQQIFTYGTNNSFTLKIENEHSNRIKRSDNNYGFIECAITENDNENDDIKTETIKYLGKKYVDKESTVKYKRLDFSKLKKINQYGNAVEYLLRIDYTHPCFDRKTIIFKKVKFVDENPKMTVMVQDENNKINNNDIITIHSIEEFPLKIIADIHQEYDDTHKINKGYCELSIDDEVRQTSYVNDSGIAEFYLNKNTDNLKTSQVIKIEYFEKYNAVKEYKFFTLKLAEDFQGKDAVPIRFNILDNTYIEQIKDNITIKRDDCLLIDINTNDNRYLNYSIRLYKEDENNKEYITFSNNKTYVNITSNKSNSIVIGDYIKNYIKNNNTQDKTIKYTAVTDSLIEDIDENNNITYNNNKKYRKYEKYITVTWTEA